MTKALKKMGIEGMYFNIIKVVYDTSLPNLTPDMEKLKPFPLKSGIKEECPLSPVLFNVGFETLAIAIRQGKERKMDTNTTGGSHIPVCR
jgi:hypothetical protein